MFKYPASVHGYEFTTKMFGEDSGQRYGEYIEASLEGRVLSGDMTEAQAMSVTLGELLQGNDGE